MIIRGIPRGSAHVGSLPPAAQHGWRVEGGALQPVLMTKTPAPQGLELTASHCKKYACHQASRLEAITCHAQISVCY